MPGFLSLLVHDITVTTPVGSSSEDRYGNPIDDVEVTVERARIEPAASDEELINRDTRITEFRGFLLPTTNLTARSTVSWEGRTLRVQGEPRPFYGRKSLHHYEVTLEEVLG